MQKQIANRLLSQQLNSSPMPLTNSNNNNRSILSPQSSSSSSIGSNLFNTNDSIENFGKHCENPECSAPTLISLVRQHQTPQYIQEPTVIDDPLLISGYTTVFQITGKQADLPKPSQNDDTPDKPIYKIIPNTHAHIVNFVVVDSDGEMFRKIKDNDPTTLKKLMDAQKSSADQLLDKLIGIKKSTQTHTKNLPKFVNNNLQGKPPPPTQQIKKPSRQLTTLAGQQQNSSNILSSSPGVVVGNSSSSSGGGISGGVVGSNVNVPVNDSIPKLYKNVSIRHVTTPPVPATTTTKASGVITVTPPIIPLQAKPVSARGRGRPPKTAAVNLTQLGHPNLKITSVQSMGTVPPIIQSATAPAQQQKSDLEKMRDEINELKECVKRFAAGASNESGIDSKKQKT